MTLIYALRQVSKEVRKGNFICLVKNNNGYAATYAAAANRSEIVKKYTPNHFNQTLERRQLIGVAK